MIKISEKEKQKAIELYLKKYNLYQICAELNYPKNRRNYISKIIRESGINMRKYTGKCTVDTSYFEKIDSEEKSYFLGYLFADGCIYGRDKNAWNTSLCIAEKDRYIIENFSKACKSTYSIRIVKKEKPTWQNQCGVSITNTEFTNHLRNLGCDENKSETGIIPDCVVNNEILLSRFMNGLFDGDGSLSRSHKYYTYPCVSFCLNNTMTIQVEEIIKKIINKKPQVLKLNKICRIQIHKQQSIDFLDWMYKYLDNGICLSRKYDRYTFFVKYYKNATHTRSSRSLRTEMWNTNFVNK
jgi:hypothetical protein